MKGGNLTNIKFEFVKAEERLPQKSGDYIIIKNNGIDVVNYSSEHKKFNCFDSFSEEDKKIYSLENVEYWAEVPKWIYDRKL